MAATQAKALRIINSDWYKKLDPKWQGYVKAAYYESYVMPAYGNSKLPIPDRNTWISNIDRPRNPFVYAASDPAAYYEPEGYKNFDHFAYHELGSLGDIFRGMSNAGIWQTKELALAALKLDKFFGGHPTAEGKEVTPEDFENFQKYEKQQTENISHTIFGNIDFWNQTHPSQSLGDKIGSFTGEVIATLPLYEALDESLAFKGEQALKVLDSGKFGNKLANFSKFLQLSDKGQFLARRLSNAANGYLSSVFSGGDAKQNTISAMAVLGLASGGEIGSGLIRVGSGLLAKKFTAEILAQGGRPFQEAVTSHAAKELEETAGTEIKTPEEFQELITKLHEEDQVKHDLVSAEKGVLNSLSLIQFGKTYGKLDSAERAAVRIARANQVNETIKEFPVHAPEIAKAEIESNLAKERKENPHLDQQINYLEQKYGTKFSSELQKAEAEKIKLETGIKSPEQATAKSGKISQLVEKEDKQKLEEAAEVEPRRYVQFKANSLAYFTNPRPKNNQFNYRSWLEDLDDKDFDKEVRDHMGNPWFFENTQHMMLWAYNFRNKMDQAFRERIGDRLEELDPTGTPAKWARQASNLERHLEKLADTGKLFSEKNIFRSSNFDTWGNRTKWQKQLNNQDLEKAEKLQLAKILQPYGQNFPVQVKIAETTLKNLQLARRKAINAGEDQKITEKIKDLISTSKARILPVSGGSFEGSQIYYHGTTSNFEDFDPRKGDFGIHFGSLSQAEVGFSKNFSEGSNIRPIKANIKNPLRLRDYGGFGPWNVAPQLYDKGWISKDFEKYCISLRGTRGLDNLNAQRKLQDVIEEHGYDSVVYLNRYDEIHAEIDDYGWLDKPETTDMEVKRKYPKADDSYIVWNKNQITSAFGGR